MADSRAASRRRSRWLVAVAVGIAALCLLSFLLASFPYRETLAGLLAPHRLRLTYTSQRASIPLGVTLTDVRLLSTADQPNQLLVEGSRLTLRPTIGALLFGAPAIHVTAALYGGELHALIERQENAVTVEFKLDGIDLARSRPLHQFDIGVEGKLSAHGSAELSGPSLTGDNQAKTGFTAKSVILRIAPEFPPIALGRIEGRATLDGQLLNFTQVQSQGADFAIRADGAIALADNLAESELHARVYLTPSDNGRAHFGFFLHFLPHPPSAGPYYIDGPLDAPEVH